MERGIYRRGFEARGHNEKQATTNEGSSTLPRSTWGCLCRDPTRKHGRCAPPASTAHLLRRAPSRSISRQEEQEEQEEGKVCLCCLRRLQQSPQQRRCGRGAARTVRRSGRRALCPHHVPRRPTSKRCVCAIGCEASSLVQDGTCFFHFTHNALTSSHILKTARASSTRSQRG